MEYSFYWEDKKHQKRGQFLLVKTCRTCSSWEVDNYKIYLHDGAGTDNSINEEQ
jgi:hypothetical protein